MEAPSLPPAVLPVMPPIPAPADAPRLPAAQPWVVVGQSPPALYTPGSVYFNQPDQFQAAKYFTFIFFGLSCFVILLFGGFVVCHCYRRLRRQEPEVPVVQMSGNAGGSPGEMVIMVPMKEGRLVSNPDGGMEVAYIPDSPRPPAAKSPPSTPSTGDRPPPSSAAESPADSPGVSQPLPTSSGARVASGPESAAAHAGVSALRTASGRLSNTGGDAEGQTNNERLDDYWRRRHAQVYHFF